MSPHSCEATTGRGGQLGGAATGEPTLAFGYLLQRRWGVDDVVMLVEQLDMATFALSEESQEADRLHLFVARSAIGRDVKDGVSRQSARRRR